MTDGKNVLRLPIVAGGSLVQEVGCSSGQLFHRLGAGVEGMTNLYVRSARVYSKVALTKQRLRLELATVGTADNKRGVNGPLEVARNDTGKYRISQFLPQLLGLRYAFPSQVTGHLALQYVTYVLLRLPVAGYV